MYIFPFYRHICRGYPLLRNLQRKTKNKLTNVTIKYILLSEITPVIGDWSMIPGKNVYYRQTKINRIHHSKKLYIFSHSESNMNTPL